MATILSHCIPYIEYSYIIILSIINAKACLHIGACDSNNEALPTLP